ncbi:hypothetical protein GCM10020366_06960 [Saccharopolyspora gregorii]|uniref:DUF4081 domain-containing protein n=1 Tax=Saccharopolyspora gregorii TaxID=33914 RepID=A0ABP6RJU5_9PSEU
MGLRQQARRALLLGVNLIPLSGGPDAMRAFADRVLRRRRVCSSLVGPAEQVLALWDELAGQWGPAREIREEQPLLVLTGAPPSAPTSRCARSGRTSWTGTCPPRSPCSPRRSASTRPGTAVPPGTGRASPS